GNSFVIRAVAGERGHVPRGAIAHAGEHLQRQLAPLPLEHALLWRDNDGPYGQPVVRLVGALLQPPQEDLRLRRVRWEPLAAAVGNLRCGLQEQEASGWMRLVDPLPLRVFDDLLPVKRRVPAAEGQMEAALAGLRAVAGALVA